MLFVPKLVMANACVGPASGGDGKALWSATGTWSGCGGVVPTANDTCNIQAGSFVVMDATAGVCGELTVNGNLRWLDGQASLLTVGDGVGALHDTVTIGSAGTITIGAGTALKINTNNPTGTTDGRITNNGTLIVGGRQMLAQGVVDSVSETITTLTGSTITLTVRNYDQPTPYDQFNGKILQFTSGNQRWQTFDVTTSGSPAANTITLSKFTRGAYDARNAGSDASLVAITGWRQGDWGQTYSTGTATVASGSTAVTGGGGATWTGQMTIGSRFACAADLNAANDTDIRRICSFTDGTHFTLCSNYGTASCAAGAAYVIYDDNMPANATPPSQSIRAGDTFTIWDPATITIPVANRSDTDMQNHYHIVANDGSLTLWKYADISYCGTFRPGQTSQYCLLASQINNTNTTEGLYLSDFDMWHDFGQNIIELRDDSHVTVERFVIRDAAAGGDTTGGSGHGLVVNDTASSGRMENFTARNGRIVRVNDDTISLFSIGESDKVVCNHCAVRNMILGYSPNTTGGSVQGVENASGNTMHDLTIENNLITNFGGFSGSDLIDLVTPASRSIVMSVLIRNNVMLNSQSGRCVSGSATSGTDPDDSNWRVNIVGNYMRDCSGIIRGHIRSNVIDSHNLDEYNASSDLLNNPQLVESNILIEPKNVANNYAGVNYPPGATNFLVPSTINIRDNVFVSNPTNTLGVWTGGVFGSGTAVGSTVALSHNTIFGFDDRTTAFSTLSRGVSCFFNGPTCSSSDDFVANVYYGVVDSNGGASTLNVSCLMNAYVQSVCGTCDTNTSPITATSFGFADPYTAFDFNAVGGSPQLENSACDGTIRGARYAGPPLGYNAFKSIAPWLTPVPTVNNYSGLDTDGDGVWDAYDNCKYTFNPTQYDGDGDGKGCACDSGDTCP